VIILGVTLAILVVVIPLYWSQISHLFLGLEPSCTIGVTGTNATLTIQAWDADSACQQLVDRNNAQHPGQYYIFTGETNAPVLCEVDMQGRHYTVRDQGIFDLVGNALCKGLEGQGSTPNPATDVANKYYTAIQSQDYATAYSYLDASSITFNNQSLTQSLYTQAAQAVDAQKGKVTSYSITSTNLNTSNGVNTASCTISVTRNGSPYDVHLKLQQEGNDWKIVSIDNV